MKTYLKRIFMLKLRHAISNIRKSNKSKLNSENLVCFAFEPTADLIGFHGAPEFDDFHHSMQVLQRLGYKFDLALDIGANIGAVSQVLSAKYKRVLAFEPNPEVFKLLEINALYCKCKNVEPLKYAVSSKKRNLILSDWNMHHSGQASLEKKHVDAQSSENAGFVAKTHKVKSVSIDELIDEKGLHEISLLKIDVEGHEIDVLKGAKKLISKYSPPIIFEDWETRNSKNSELRTELIKLGYSTFIARRDYPHSLFNGKALWCKCINLPYKLIISIFTGYRTATIINENSAIGGYEHVLAIKETMSEKDLKRIVAEEGLEPPTRGL